MKLFLDTANALSIQKGKASGLINGVTTNPTHLSKEGGSIKDLLESICTVMAPDDVSIEVTDLEPQEVYEQAKRIADIAPNVVVKIPCHKAYAQVINKLVHEGIKINVTLLFSAVQGLLMCKLGVRYISPFIGRLDDIDVDGIELIYDLKKIIENYGFTTQILAASLRHVRHVHDVALSGADIATVPVKLFDELLNHPLTDKGIALFDADWRKLGLSHFPKHFA